MDSRKEKSIQRNPLYRFYVFDPEQNVALHYAAPFMPRVGDTINLVELSFRVTGVVLETGNDGGAGMFHSGTVHVERCEPLPEAPADVEELDDFIRKARTQLEKKRGGKQKRKRR